MSKTKSVYFCTECGNETPRWQGKCPACGAWNTLTEHIERGTRVKGAPAGISNAPRLITEIDTQNEIRFSTGLNELNRVLGGGAVMGSLVLVGGAHPHYCCKFATAYARSIRSSTCPAKRAKSS